MITLQTPGTGLDDFENRIALGMCRVALDCVEPEKVSLVEEFDKFVIKIDEPANVDLLNKSFAGWLIKNVSSEDTLRSIPGMRAKEIYDGFTQVNRKKGAIKKSQKKVQRKGYARKFSEFAQQFYSKSNCLNLVDIYSPLNELPSRKGSHDSVCRHDHDAKKIIGAGLGFSPQLGSPPIRDNPVRGTNPPDLCAFCSIHGILGVLSFQVDIQVSSFDQAKTVKISLMPRFRGETNGKDLLAYITATKHIRPRFNGIPSESVLLAMLSLYPHLSRLKMPDTFFVYCAEISGKAPRYQDFMEQEYSNELVFLKASSYNVAFTQKLYQSADKRPELLRMLSRTIRVGLSRDAISLHREFASVTEGQAFVYRETTDFLAKEVLKMDAKLIDDPNAGAVASMLRFFVRKQKFGYVDNLRGARDAEEFEKHLLSALRDAASIHAKPNEQKDNDEKFLYLPNDTQVREFLKLLHADRNFENVKTLVCLLSFSYWKKEE